MTAVDWVNAVTGLMVLLVAIAVYARVRERRRLFGEVTKLRESDRRFGEKLDQLEATLNELGGDEARTKGHAEMRLGLEPLSLSREELLDWSTRARAFAARYEALLSDDVELFVHLSAQKLSTVQSASSYSCTHERLTGRRFTTQEKMWEAEEVFRGELAVSA